MGSTSSTAHPHFFCRALHLTPSDKKLGRGANQGNLRQILKENIQSCTVCTVSGYFFAMHHISQLLTIIKEFSEFRMFLNLVF
jgi:hypothetical protein